MAALFLGAGEGVEARGKWPATYEHGEIESQIAALASHAPTNIHNDEGFLSVNS